MGMVRLLVFFVGLVLGVSATASAKDAATAASGGETAIFAGGCFWCVEQAFDGVDGVLETTSGFSGGTVANPTYGQVSAGGTKHAEVVLVRYDPNKVSYEDLLRVFWRNVDPVDGGGQFCDRGDSYRSAIFYKGAAQEKAARESKMAVEKQLGRSVTTELAPAAAFYPANTGHQDYYLKNPVRYKFYKWNCGRAQRLEEIWGPPEK